MNKHTLSLPLLTFPLSHSNDSGEAPPPPASPPHEWVSITSQSLLGAISGHGCAGDSAYEFMGDIESVAEIPDAKYNNRKKQSRLV